MVGHKSIFVVQRTAITPSLSAFHTCSVAVIAIYSAAFIFSFFNFCTWRGANEESLQWDTGSGRGGWNDLHGVGCTGGENEKQSKRKFQVEKADLPLKHYKFLFSNYKFSIFIQNFTHEVYTKSGKITVKHPGGSKQTLAGTRETE